MGLITSIAVINMYIQIDCVVLPEIHIHKDNYYEQKYAFTIIEQNCQIKYLKISAVFCASLRHDFS